MSTVINPCGFELASTVHVRCTAAKGMFPHEAGVLIKGMEHCYEAMIDAELISLENNETLSDDDQPAWVDAKVIKTDCKSVLIELPRQVISGGRRIWVPISEVEK